MSLHPAIKNSMTDASFDKWLKQMESQQKKSLEACEKTINSTVREMVERIIERTPLGDPSLWHYPAPKNYKPGTLKASWEINTNNSARDFKTGRYKRMLQSTSGASIAQQWQGIKLNINTTPTITIVNRQPYAWRVEYGSWSTQAPQGMMRITIQEYKTILESYARKNKL